MLKKWGVLLFGALAGAAVLIAGATAVSAPASPLNIDQSSRAAVVNYLASHGIDAKNPLSFFAVKQRIEAGLRAHTGRFVVVPLPNITHVLYGRDVGYVLEQVELDGATQAISATEIREQISNP